MRNRGKVFDQNKSPLPGCGRKPEDCRSKSTGRNQERGESLPIRREKGGFGIKKSEANQRGGEA